MFNFYFRYSSEIMFFFGRLHSAIQSALVLVRITSLWFFVFSLTAWPFIHFHFIWRMSATFSGIRIIFNSIYTVFVSSFVICFFSRRRTEIARGIQVHNLGKIDKQLHVAAKSDHKTFAQKRFRRIHVHQCQCVGKTRCSHTTSR